jgi:predicted protein tyrosine phosphatase
MAEGSRLNWYWILPGRFLAGEYPGAAEEGEARRRLGLLLAQGVTWILDLTQAGEYGLLPYETQLPGGTVSYRRLAIPDYGTPPESRMRSIQAEIHKALADGQTIYVHCYGGVGRTGTVVGCYLRERGLDGTAALAKIAELRRSLANGHLASPETESQRRLIMNWKAQDDDGNDGFRETLPGG